MELRLVILSVACFSCLIPSALSINLVAAKAVASQAATDIATIGAETIAAKKEAVVKAATDILSIGASAAALKGKALTTAAASIAGAMLNGAVSAGATIAKAGVNMIAAKLGAPSALVLEPSIVIKPPRPVAAVENHGADCAETVGVEVPTPPISSVSVDYRPPVFSLPSLNNIAPIWSTVQEAVPAIEFVESDTPFIYESDTPFIYEVVDTPLRFTGPLLETFQFKK